MEAKIVFDREAVASRGTPGDAANSPEQLVARREAGLRLMADLAGASEVEYIDNDKQEVYRIAKPDGRRFELTAYGNQYDGGWVNLARLADSHG